jgi:hypothetical protein
MVLRTEYSLMGREEEEEEEEEIASIPHPFKAPFLM